MSEFPKIGEYKNAQSAAQIRFLEKNGCSAANGAPPFVIKKEKGACLYDIDGNKYADFDLSDGAVIAGHGHRTLTQFIKGGLSSGMSSGLLNKFVYRLTRLFKEIADFKHIAFFNGLDTAVHAIVRAVKPAKIGVTSKYLLDALSPYGAVMAEKGQAYDLLFFEPLDFDGDLGETGIAGYKAVKTCSVENRTAFRIKFGFLSGIEKTDFILSANNIANGMDSAVVLSGTEVMGERIPVYKSVAVLETLKYYRRNIDYRSFGHETVKAAVNGPVRWNKSIFQFKSAPNPAIFISRGVYLKGKVGFICAEHTEHDWKRLLEADQKTGN